MTPQDKQPGLEEVLKSFDSLLSSLVERWVKKDFENVSRGIKPFISHVHSLAYKNGREESLDEIRNNPKIQAPMGVSQWMNHGEEYHYADFWKDKIRQEAREEVIKEIRNSLGFLQQAVRDALK